jgi:signal transduction histidine kinase
LCQSKEIALLEHSSNIISTYLPLSILFAIGVIWIYSIYERKKRKENIIRNDFFKELEEERRAIASEIHDTLGGFLVPLKQMIHDGASFESKDVRELWIDLIEKYQNEMTFTNSKIYPVVLQESDLYESLESLSSTFTSSTCFVGITIEERIPLTEICSIHIFRIIQESIVNAVKHSVPTYIQVMVTSDNHEALNIVLMYPSNEIKGTQRISKTGHRGQRILTERLSFVGGKRTLLLEDGFATEEFNFTLPVYENSNS